MTSDGQPFFRTADTAWKLFNGLTEDEVGAHLDKRASRGFNVVQALDLDS